MKTLIIILSCSLFSFSKACQCPELLPLSKKSFSSYSLVFYGNYESSTACKNNAKKARFIIQELFKGDVVEERIEIELSCGNELCAINLEKDQQWLIFATKNNAQEFTLDFCSHSRRLLPQEQIDYETEIRGTSFFEDKEFLTTNFGIKELNKKGLQAKKYEKVDDALIPVLLGVSLLFMVVGTLLFRKKKNK